MADCPVPPRKIQIKTKASTITVTKSQIATVICCRRCRSRKLRCRMAGRSETYPGPAILDGKGRLGGAFKVAAFASVFPGIEFAITGDLAAGPAALLSGTLIIIDAEVPSTVGEICNAATDSTVSC